MEAHTQNGSFNEFTINGLNKSNRAIRSRIDGKCMQTFMTKLAFVVAIFCVSAALLCRGAYAQTIGTGAIQGTVLDQSGAAVVNASVTAVDPATGYTVAQHTSGAGFYVLPSLPAATYTVTITATGFETVLRNDVIVNALETVGLNLHLAVGKSSQTVVVSGLPPQLNTSNGNLQVTIPNSTYSSLPLALSGGPKSPMGFVTLLPGASGGQFGVNNLNGGVGQTAFIYVNGMPLMTSELQGDARNINGSTSTEVVDQFQVITSGVPAYYQGQGVTNFILKSGTNHFHGDIYENFRNTALDAAGYFASTTPVEHQNEYGGTIGGPIIRNKLFFFFNYDGYRLKEGANPVLSSIPTLKERTGDFSELSTPIYDPSTTVCTGGVCTRQAFAGNQILVISPISASLQSKLPTPINSNLQNNFLYALTGGTNQDMYMGKADYTVSQSNHAYFLIQHGVVSQPSLGANGGPQLPLPYTSSRFGGQTIELYQFGDTEAITSNLVNTLGYQVNRFITPFTNPTTSGNWAAQAGLTGIPGGQASENFPPIFFGNPGGSSPNSNNPSTGSDDPTNWAQDFNSQSFSDLATTSTFQDNLQWIHGKHSFTFGGQIVFQAEATSKPSQLNNLSFSNLQTAGFDGSGGLETSTGNSYASYLLGDVNNGSLTDTAVAEFGGRYRSYAMYAQDDWKVTDKLVLNLGLRYTIPKPFYEVKNRASFLNATLPNPAVDGYPGALQFAGSGTDSCNCKTLVKTHYLTFGPRLGFAYSLTPKKVIRGSFTAIHYNTGALGGNATSTGSGAIGAAGVPLGYSSTPTFSSPDSFTPAFNWNAGFPDYTHPPFFDPTLNTGYNTTAGAQAGEITYTRPDTGGRSPVTDNWNLTYEQQLTQATVVSLSYAGSVSKLIPLNGGYGIYSNQIDPKYLQLGGLLLQAETPATLAQAQAIIPSITLPYANFEGSIGQMVRPFPQYSGIYDTNADFGRASYNSFQGYLQHSMSRGLYLLASYTYSKQVDNVGGANVVAVASGTDRSAYNLDMDRAISSGDQTHIISISYVYALPFGRGHAIGGSNNVMNAIVGGWQLSGIDQYSSGNPIGNIGASCNVPYTGGCVANYNPSFSGPVRINGSYGSGNPKGGTPYLDYHAFLQPASYTFGNTPVRGVFRLRQPWNRNEDLSLAKTFGFTAGTSLRLQVDAFNLFNRTQFGGLSTNLSNPSTFGTFNGQANSPRKLQLEAYIHF
jgi:hypothetical protein